MKALFIILLLIVAGHSVGQKQRLLNSVLVNNFQRPIPNAAVFLYTAIDSQLVSTTYSNSKGKIELSFDTSFLYYFIIVKDSFKTKTIQQDFKSKSWPDTIYLEYNNIAENNAVVIASPIIIKEDTVQFDSALFKKDSLKTLEEILKKFPGVTIDRDGTILVHGVAITEILLDGKPLPYNDPKLLTQTLQASAIDKIQFIEQKSEQTKLTKIDDGKRNKVINVKLKSKTKRSLNQSYALGVGNQGRIQSSAGTNGMHDNFYGNITANYNNTGKSNFNNISFQNNAGIVTGGSINASARWLFSKITLNTSVNFSNNKTEQDELRDRVIFLKDSLNYYNQHLLNTTTANNTSFRIDAIYSPDSLGDWRTGINYSQGSNKSFRNDQFSTKNNSKVLLNNGYRQNNINSFRDNFSFSLSGGRRTRSNSLSIYFNVGINNTNSDNTNFQNNNIIFYRSSGLGFDTAKQRIFNLNDGFSASTNTNLQVKLYKTLRFSVGVSTNHSTRPIEREAFFYNSATGLYEIANTALKNQVVNNTNTSNFSTGLLYRYKEHSFNFSIVQNFLNNSNNDKFRDTLIKQINRFITPSFSYNFTSKKGYTANQTIAVRQIPPTTQQLQSIVDNTNPLFIRKGNPNLKTEERYDINTSFRKNPNRTSQKKFTIHISFNNSLNITKNRIANNTFFDVAEGKQVSTPINLPDVWSNSSYYNINLYIEKYKINIYQKSNLNISRDNNFLNNELNELKNVAIRPSLGIKQNKKKFDFDYNIGYLYQTNLYSLRPNQNIKLGSFTTDASLEWNFYKTFKLELDYRQTVNNNKRSLQRINNLNGSIDYTIKGQKMNTRFAFQAFDILNQNNNLVQNINDYYEEFVITNAVRRYYMVSIILSHNKFSSGKKTKKQK